MPHQGNNRVLVINPGSTSTKFGVFSAEGAEWVSSVHHGDEEIEQFRGRSMLARTGYRAALIEKALAAAGYDSKQFAAVGDDSEDGSAAGVYLFFQQNLRADLLIDPILPVTGALTVV